MISQLRPQLIKFVDILLWGFFDFIEKYKSSNPYQYYILNAKNKYYSKENIRLQKRGKKARYKVWNRAKQADIERCATVGTDIEVIGVPLDGSHNHPGAGTVVYAGALDMDIVGLKVREDALKRVLLVEAHVGVAVAVLYPYDEVTYGGNAGAVVGELHVGHLRVELPGIYELVVEVHVVRFARHELACFHQFFDKQAFQPGCSIEIVALALVGGQF